jgi:hypothetical protein
MQFCLLRFCSTFDRGKAQAYSALSRIFAVKGHSTDWNSNYLSSLYRGIETVRSFIKFIYLQKCLKKNNYMMAVILNHSVNLFQSELKGVRILVPSYLYALETVLTNSGKPLEGISSKIQTLRQSCIKIIGSWISLPHHFGTLKFREKDSVVDVYHFYISHFTSPT